MKMQWIVKIDRENNETSIYDEKGLKLDRRKKDALKEFSRLHDKGNTYIFKNHHHE